MIEPIERIEHAPNVVSPILTQKQLADYVEAPSKVVDASHAAEAESVEKRHPQLVKAATKARKAGGKSDAVAKAVTDKLATFQEKKRNIDAAEQKHIVDWVMENVEPHTSNAASATLIKRIKENAVALLRTKEDKAFVRVTHGSHIRTYAVRGKAFQSYVQSVQYGATECAATRATLEDVIGTIEAMALHSAESTVRDVRLRVAGNRRGPLFIDLGNADWTCVKVTREGWEVVPHGEVPFRRANGTHALPTPVRAEGPLGTALDEFFAMVNLTAEDRALSTAWMVAALLPNGPYPLQCIIGEQGSGKSVYATQCVRLIDPQAAVLRSAPTDTHALSCAAHNSHVLSFDNLSGLRQDVSDALCTIATGGTYATRELYSDKEENLISECCPVVVTGILEIAKRPDLVDRAVAIHPKAMANEQRKSEEELNEAFDEMRPRVFAALLDAIVYGLAHYDKSAGSGARMAGFEAIALAAEPAFGVNCFVGTFAKAYAESRGDAHTNTLEDEIIVKPLFDLLDDNNGTWDGLMDELLDALKEVKQQNTWVSTSAGATTPEPLPLSWPKMARSLSVTLARIKPALRHAGVEIDTTQRKKEGRIVKLSRSS